MEDPLEYVRAAEISLLKNSSVVSPRLILESLQCGSYNDVISNEKFIGIFTIPADFSLESDRPLEVLKHLVSSYVCGHVTPSEQLEVLCFGIACLNSFIQFNWTGPNFAFPSDLASLLKPAVRKCFPEDVPRYSDYSESLRLALSEDGEEIYETVLYPELLISAVAVFSSHLPALVSREWWLFRSLFVQQQILNEYSSTLLESLNKISNKILNSEWIADDKYLKVLSHLEVARIYLHFERISSSEIHLKNALSSLKMNVNLSGALGKRTYYQSKDVAQIMLDVQVDRVLEIENVNSIDVDFPKDVMLNDEVRMPKVTFTNPDDGQYPELQPLEQAALLALFIFNRKSQAKDNLQDEELMPYLNCLLTHPKVWAFHFSALYLRSRIERDHKRTIERALLQMQVLMELESNKAAVSDRLRLFHCSYTPSKFTVASDSANILISIGSIQSALDIFLQLHLWEEVISCYNYLKLRHKAEEVIREQMKKGETVKLWCYLGDATDDVSCYEKAWQLSNNKSAQAQRHWGMFYFNKKMYKECIEHFNISLSINSLQISLWYRLGFANLKEHHWEESATAYRRYCALEPGSFEAWNNLAKAYIILGQKNRAFHSLQEAIKCNFDTWQVWDNLMAVCCDIGEFEEAIRAYHRVLDLKHNMHVDEQILSVLTSVILKNEKNCRGQPASVLRKKLLELFGRITSKILDNPKVWMMYAQLTASIEDQTPNTWSKVVQYYKKAYAVATQDPNWFKHVESLSKVMDISKELSEAVLEFSKCASRNETEQSLSSAKFTLKNVLAVTGDLLNNDDGSQNLQAIKDNFVILENNYQEIQVELSRVKES